MIILYIVYQRTQSLSSGKSNLAQHTNNDEYAKKIGIWGEPKSIFVVGEMSYQ